MAPTVADLAGRAPTPAPVHMPGHQLGATAWQRATTAAWLEERGHNITTDNVAEWRIEAARQILAHLAELPDTAPRPPADLAADQDATVARLRLSGWTFAAIAAELDRYPAAVRAAWDRTAAPSGAPPLVRRARPAPPRAGGRGGRVGGLAHRRPRVRRVRDVWPTDTHT